MGILPKTRKCPFLSIFQYNFLKNPKEDTVPKEHLGASPFVAR